LAGPTGNQLHRLGDSVFDTVVRYDQVDMVGGDGEIQDGKTKMLLRFKEQIDPAFSVSGKL